MARRGEENHQHRSLVDLRSGWKQLFMEPEVRCAR